MTNIIPLKTTQISVTVDHMTAIVQPITDLPKNRYSVQITRYYLDDDGKQVQDQSCYLDRELLQLKAMITLIEEKIRSHDTDS